MDVRAVDSSGAESPAARGTQNVTGTNATPVEGSVSLAPLAPKTDQTLTASTAGFTEPDGEPLTYHYRWLRNGTTIAGATSPTLNLSQAGAGDRGDAIRVEVHATDPGGRASDPVAATVTVANTAPAAGTVSVKPSAPSSDEIVSARPTGFADNDGDAVSYVYQWFVNGAAIGDATGRTLDLSEPGHGDPGDRVEVAVTALDGNGGTQLRSARQRDGVLRAVAHRRLVSASRRPAARRSRTRAERTTAPQAGRRAPTTAASGARCPSTATTTWPACRIARRST